MVDSGRFSDAATCPTVRSSPLPSSDINACNSESSQSRGTITAPPTGTTSASLRSRSSNAVTRYPLPASRLWCPVPEVSSAEQGLPRDSDGDSRGWPRCGSHDCPDTAGSGSRPIDDREQRRWSAAWVHLPNCRAACGDQVVLLTFPAVAGYGDVATTRIYTHVLVES